MSHKSRVERRDELLTNLGFLVDPIRRTVLKPDVGRSTPSDWDSFMEEYPDFIGEVGALCQDGDQFFGAEFEAVRVAVVDIYYHLPVFSDMVNHPGMHKEAFDTVFGRLLEGVRKAIRSIPGDDHGIILPTESPFSTYIITFRTTPGGLNRWGSTDAAFIRFEGEGVGSFRLRLHDKRAANTALAHPA